MRQPELPLTSCLHEYRIIGRQIYLPLQEHLYSFYSQAFTLAIYVIWRNFPLALVIWKPYSYARPFSMKSAQLPADPVFSPFPELWPNMPFYYSELSFMTSYLLLSLVLSIHLDYSSTFLRDHNLTGAIRSLKASVETEEVIGRLVGLYICSQGYPDGASGKEPVCQCGRHKICRFSSWVEKISWRRKWQPTPIFLPGESHGQRSLLGYSHGVARSQTQLK